jgi:hypothetical protein
MHTAAKTTSETNSAHTQAPEEALAHIKAVYRVKRLESELTMITAQTKAMEALIYCMTPIQSTGDSKIDAFYAKERNRQRLAATQTLLHIRTVKREKRLRRTMRANAKAKADRLEPNRASDGSQATSLEMPTPPAPSKDGVVKSEAHVHVDSLAQASPDHGLRPIEDRTQTMPPLKASPARTRSRYKTRKPKHPKQPARRKR